MRKPSTTVEVLLAIVMLALAPMLISVPALTAIVLRRRIRHREEGQSRKPNTGLEVLLAIAMLVLAPPWIRVPVLGAILFRRRNR